MKKKVKIINNGNEKLLLYGVINRLLELISTEQKYKLEELSYCFGNGLTGERCLFITTKFGDVDKILGTFLLNDL